MTSLNLLWDWGTAYDLFVSLAVLHEPAEFGLRGAWAAGVRARLPCAEREALEQSQWLWQMPFHWLYTLPRPKDGEAVLWSLGQMPPEERLPALALSPVASPSKVDILMSVATRQSWREADRQALRAAYQDEDGCGTPKKVPSSERVVKILDCWASAGAFGERYLSALRAYQEAFFAEEEGRIRPALQQALARARELVTRLALPDLWEELSQGLRLDVMPEADSLILVPSYWCTPLVFFGKASVACDIWLFGARSAEASLVPGETIPESLLRSLKALSDPTRLRMLHYLTQAPLTPAQLSRRLRLRAPTVTHHLEILRLAGLVQVTLGERREVKCYAARRDAVAAAWMALDRFLGEGEHQG